MLAILSEACLFVGKVILLVDGTIALGVGLLFAWLWFDFRLVLRRRRADDLAAARRREAEIAAELATLRRYEPSRGAYR